MADYAIHEETLVEISNVIRKKDGTSALIDPADYADRINLMGMLEEKTVSSSPIVTFSDGADAVALKKCEVTLPASLDGYSSVDVVHTGANLLDFTVHDHFGITCEKTADGGAKMSGTATNTSYPVNWIPITLPAGTYHVYISAVGTGMTIAYSKNGGYGGNLYAGDNVITLNTETEIGGYIRVSNGTVISEPETVYMQLSLAQADYEPYTAPTTHTASLGRTIYGGSVDVVTGEGKSTHANVKVSDLTWQKQTASGRDFFIAQVSDMKTGTPKDIDSVLPYGGEITVAAMADKSLASWTNSLRIYDTDITTVSELLETYGNDGISYPLATPTDFAFDPVSIDSKLGNNTIWSEQGDTEVTYRSQGTTTPILPTLVTKTITENGTYAAEDDDADGYSEVTVNVKGIPKLTVNEGELSISTGTITTSSTYCYTEPFDCPNGTIVFDCGEQTSAVNVGLELINADNSHANYFTCASRYREVDISQYYSATKKARLAFKKQYLSKVLLMDFGNGKIYSSLNASQFEEPQANLLSMNNAQSEESEGSEE